MHQRGSHQPGPVHRSKREGRTASVSQQPGQSHELGGDHGGRLDGGAACLLEPNDCHAEDGEAMLIRMNCCGFCVYSGFAFNTGD